MNWGQIIITALTSSVFTGILAFLAKSLIGQWLSKSLAKFKVDLQLAAFEHQTRFTKLHEERAKVIAGLYSLLVQAQRDFEDLTHYIEHQEKQKQAERIGALLKSSGEFFKYFDEHRIYLDEDLCDKLEKLYRVFQEIVGDYRIALAYDPTVDAEAFMRLKKGYDKIVEGIPALRQGIEKEFRQLLFVSS